MCAIGPKSSVLYDTGPYFQKLNFHKKEKKEKKTKLIQFLKKHISEISDGITKFKSRNTFQIQSSFGKFNFISSIRHLRVLHTEVDSLRIL